MVWSDCLNCGQGVPVPERASVSPVAVVDPAPTGADEWPAPFCSRACEDGYAVRMDEATGAARLMLARRLDRALEAIHPGLGGTRGAGLPSPAQSPSLEAECLSCSRGFRAWVGGIAWVADVAQWDDGSQPTPFCSAPCRTVYARRIRAADSIERRVLVRRLEQRWETIERDLRRRGFVP